MSKENWVVSLIVVVGLLVGLAVSVYILYTPSKEIIPTDASRDFSLIPGVPTMQPAINKSSVKADITYMDEAGFTFSYPKGVNVVDSTPDDGVHYTRLYLKRGGEEMTVVMKDTSYKSTSGWRSAQEGKVTLIGAVSMDGISAEQYVTDESLITVAVDQGVLYLIESPRDVDYWDIVQDIFASSFSFEESSVDDSLSTPDSNTIYEPEETVE